MPQKYRSPCSGVNSGEIATIIYLEKQAKLTLHLFSTQMIGFINTFKNTKSFVLTLPMPSLVFSVTSVIIVRVFLITGRPQIKSLFFELQAPDLA